MKSLTRKPLSFYLLLSFSIVFIPHCHNSRKSPTTSPASTPAASPASSPASTPVSSAASSPASTSPSSSVDSRALAPPNFVYSLVCFLNYEDKDWRVTFFHGNQISQLQTPISNGDNQTLSGTGKMHFVHQSDNTKYMEFTALLNDKNLNVTLVNHRVSPPKSHTKTFKLKSFPHPQMDGVLESSEHQTVVLNHPFTFSGKQIEKITYHCNYEADLGDSEKQLYKAVLADDMNQADELLQSGVNPNFYRRHKSPLITAKTKAMAKLLLSHGADTSFDENVFVHPLSNVLDFDFSIFKELIEHTTKLDYRFKNGQTLLTLAVRYNHQDAATHLLKKGANIHFANARNIQPVWFAYKNLPLLKILLSQGADINACDDTGITILERALLKGNSNLALHLLSRGASLTPNKKFSVDPMMLPAIALAIKTGNVPLVKKIYQPGTELNQEISYEDSGIAPKAEDRNNKGNYLHMAIVSGFSGLNKDPNDFPNLSIIKWLLKMGLNPNEKFGNGFSAIELVDYYISECSKANDPRLASIINGLQRLSHILKTNSN